MDLCSLNEHLKELKSNGKTSFKLITTKNVFITFNTIY